MGGNTDYCNWLFGAEVNTTLGNMGKLKHLLMSTSVLNPDTIVAEWDSAVTADYWRKQDEIYFKNIIPYSDPSVTLPDIDTILPINQGILLLSNKIS